MATKTTKSTIKTKKTTKAPAKSAKKTKPAAKASKTAKPATKAVAKTTAKASKTAKPATTAAAKTTAKAAAKPKAAAKSAPAKTTNPAPKNNSAPKNKPAPKKKAAEPKLAFKAGDYVVYPTHGVGLVSGIEKETIAGHELRLVVVTFDNDRMTLRVPTDKMEVSGLRKLSSRKVMDNAVTTLKGRARIKRTMWSRRAQEYEAKINSGDPVFIAEVVRDLHRNVGQPDQSFSERQIYEAALERLAGEFAAVESIEKEDATEKLEQVLNAA